MLKRAATANGVRVFIFRISVAIFSLLGLGRLTPAVFFSRLDGVSLGFGSFFWLFLVCDFGGRLEDLFFLLPIVVSPAADRILSDA